MHGQPNIKLEIVSAQIVGRDVGNTIYYASQFWVCEIYRTKSCLPLQKLTLSQPYVYTLSSNGTEKLLITSKKISCCPITQFIL
jgi:hypothetical protein